MREIKFRAFIDPSKTRFPEDIIIWSHREKPTNIIEDSIGQFTGLKDKNGREIYEGDICKFGSGRIREIKFKNGGFGFEPDKEYRDEFVGFAGHTDLKFVIELIEVIGNIHQNPALLK